MSKFFQKIHRTSRARNLLGQLSNLIRVTDSLFDKGQINNTLVSMTLINCSINTAWQSLIQKV